jgi:hypothetical protein
LKTLNAFNFTKLNTLGFAGLLKRRNCQTPKSEKTKKSFGFKTGDGDVVHGEDMSE